MWSARSFLCYRTHSEQRLTVTCRGLLPVRCARMKTELCGRSISWRRTNFTAYFPLESWTSCMQQGSGPPPLCPPLSFAWVTEIETHTHSHTQTRTHTDTHGHTHTHICTQMCHMCRRAGAPAPGHIVSCFLHRSNQARRIRLVCLRSEAAEEIGDGNYFYLIMLDTETKRLHKVCCPICF